MLIISYILSEKFSSLIQAEMIVSESSFPWGSFFSIVYYLPSTRASIREVDKLLDLLERAGEALDLERLAAILAAYDKIESDWYISYICFGEFILTCGLLPIDVEYKLLLCCEIILSCMKSVEDNIDILLFVSSASLSTNPCRIYFLCFVISRARYSFS